MEKGRAGNGVEGGGGWSAGTAVPEFGMVSVFGRSSHHSNCMEGVVASCSATPTHHPCPLCNHIPHILCTSLAVPHNNCTFVHPGSSPARHRARGGPGCAGRGPAGYQRRHARGGGRGAVHALTREQRHAGRAAHMLPLRNHVTPLRWGCVGF